MLPSVIQSDQKRLHEKEIYWRNYHIAVYCFVIYRKKKKKKRTPIHGGFWKSVWQRFLVVHLKKALELFNFGANIRRCMDTFCINASACVQVNGHCFCWLSRGRGTRLGDQLPPYLICAEILSTMIQENGKIKGIKPNPSKWCFLWQFAYNITLCLDAQDKHRSKVSTFKTEQS